MPSFIDHRMFLGTIFVGFLAGLITGVIGAGGGYILTPALMSLGVRGIMAVGTDQFHLFAKAIMGSTIHRRLGNVNFWLAAWFVLGSVFGVTAGGRLSRAIYQHSPVVSDVVISTVYVVVLGILGVYAIGDWLRLRRSTSQTTAKVTTSTAQFLQKLRLRPRVAFDQGIVAGGRSISVYPLIACGFVVGFAASIMGVGGGFLTFPMFVYGLGVSTFTTVGTDILQIIFTTAYSSIFQYAIYGFVSYTVCVGMLLGSLVGVQIGAMITNMVLGAQIRAFYALTILAGFVNRLCDLPKRLADVGVLSLSPDAASAIEIFGHAAFYVIIGAFAGWILWIFVTRVGASRAADIRNHTGGRSGLIVDRKKFVWGAAGLGSFAVILFLGFTPLFQGQGLFRWADGMLNRFAKNSINYLGEGAEKVEGFHGVTIDLSVRPRVLVDETQLADLVILHGLGAKVLDDGRVRITGDLGLLADSALHDAELAFNNKDEELKAENYRGAPEVIYSWWIIFDGLSRRYTQETRTTEANFTKFMAAKILEPAYNFRGIAACSCREAILPVAALLVFYVLYTVWYGFSILFLFEGFGVAAVCREKREV
ncbi:MAG: sulfite exporter TauE/SafE family protein [Candidatus Sumerlaeota bacterium]|nr:sulfite exporter TauE/SafE family protein [Candidatus Sumerlaeota bacterium]